METERGFKPKTISAKEKYDAVIELLKKHDAEYLAEDCDDENGLFEIYEFKTLTLFIYEDGRLSVSFHHNSEGCYEINDISRRHFESLLEIESICEFCGVEKLPKQQFKLAVMETLTDFLKNKED